MTCKCGSDRLASIIGKVSDNFSLSVDTGDVHHQGYVPSEIGIGGGNYIQFTYCLDCGQIAGRWPTRIDLSGLSKRQRCGLSEDDGL